MNIQRQLVQILVTIVVFSIFVIFGFFQIAKGGQFHQLNFLHLKYTEELNRQLYPKITSAQANAKTLDIHALRRTLLNIRDQPQDCLENINTLDRIVMRWINTDTAIQLCVDDIVIANEALKKLEMYQNQQISKTEIHKHLRKTALAFSDHSIRFEAPIFDTANFITQSILICFSIITLLIITSIVLVTKGISNSVVTLHKTSRALKKSEELNRQLAQYDSLTHLPNRNLLAERLAHQLTLAKRQGSSFALLFIDLDRFKIINDSMGHHVGDQLIRAAGKRIANILRESDTVARIGGDEFNIILSEINRAKDISTVAKKINLLLAQPFDIIGQQILISASIGVAIYPNDSENIEDLKKYADLAMYQSKEKGGNTFEFYSKEIHQKIYKKLEMEKELRSAVEKKEFILHFQPVIRLSDMKTVGVEALIRWQHQELGFISPMDFIPLAEETGLIIDIGQWVLEEACKNASIWREQSGTDFKVAINVSPCQLLAKNFILSIKETLELHQLPSSAIDIEITENVLIQDDDKSLAILEELSSMGINLLLDDFGTGHSSLSYLHKLPFDILKVDRSFILKMDTSSQTKNIVSSIAAMAHELNLEAVAEGVETESTLQTLRNIGCEYAQGFFLSRPVSAEKIDSNKIYTEFL